VKYRPRAQIHYGVIHNNFAAVTPAKCGSGGGIAERLSRPGELIAGFPACSRAWMSDLPFEDRTDVDGACRGLIGALDPGSAAVTP